MNKLLGLLSSVVSLSAFAQAPATQFCTFIEEGSSVSQSFEGRKQVEYSVDGIYEQDSQSTIGLSVFFANRSVLWKIFTLEKQEALSTATKLVYTGKDEAPWLNNKDITLSVDLETGNASVSHRDLKLTTICE